MSHPTSYFIYNKLFVPRRCCFSRWGLIKISRRGSGSGDITSDTISSLGQVLERQGGIRLLVEISKKNSHFAETTGVSRVQCALFFVLFFFGGGDTQSGFLRNFYKDTKQPPSFSLIVLEKQRDTVRFVLTMVQNLNIF